MNTVGSSIFKENGNLLKLFANWTRLRKKFASEHEYHLRSVIPIIARSKEKKVKAMMMMKTKKVKLYGEKLRKLNTAIHERDGNCCIICGRYVDPGEKFHHEPCGALKSDEISKGVTLCYDCHQERHCGAGSRVVKEQIKEYLQGLYGDA